MAYTGTAARASQGTILGIYQAASGSGSGTFIPVAEQINVKGPSITGKAVKATNQTTSGGTEEYIPDGLVDGGEVDLTGNFIPASHIALAEMVGTTQQIQIQWTQCPTPTPSCEFAAVVTEFEASSDEEKPLEFSCKFKVTGPVTWTA